MILSRGNAARPATHAGARRSTAYEPPSTAAAAGSRSPGRTEKRAEERTKAPAEGAAATHGHHRHQMLLARMTQGAQQRRIEKAAIRSLPDADARRTAERESRTAYDKSPENHGDRRRVGKDGVNLQKPKLESALKTAGEIMTGTAKRLQRDIRYALAPPDKNAMRIGGSKNDVHAERPSAASRPAPARGPARAQAQAQAPAPAVRKTDMQPVHAR